MKGFEKWLTDVVLKLVAPRLVAGLLLGLAMAFVALGLLPGDVQQCLAVVLAPSVSS